MSAPGRSIAVPDDGGLIEGRTIEFFADGEFIGSASTDSGGVATVTVPAGHRGKRVAYEALFRGDDFYRESSGQT
jgi:hypothetical protein